MFVSFAFLIDVVKADLKYYFYTEEAEVNAIDKNNDVQVQDNDADVMVILESVGSLPFEQSSYSTVGDSCPSMVSKAGGLNAQYLCVGLHNQKENFVFFPIAPDDSTAGARLPFKFAPLEESQGTSSGLLLWRNALAVDWSGNNDSETSEFFMNGLSFGKDTSRDRFNTKWFESANEGFEDGDVVYEWHLLSGPGGDPIHNGGSIQLIKGKPPKTTHKEQSLKNSDSATATNNNIVPEKAPEQSCQSIAQTLCDDKNDEIFGTMCSLMMQVGLDEVLSSSSGTSFTLYAPTNDAFYHAFDGKAQPALLSGHELTKLLLSHVVIADENELSQSELGTSVVRYEEMVCGTKMIMASEQVAKIGCDENAEVSYVIGAGNQNRFKPSFVAVNEETCNGLIHTLDFVILPSSGVDSVAEEHHHDHNVVDIAKVPGSNMNNNNLDESEVISFFKQTTEDIRDVTPVGTAASITSKENTVSERNELRPVTSRGQNPAIGSRKKEDGLQHTRDGEATRRHNRQMATAPEREEAHELGRQQHLRRHR